MDDTAALAESVRRRMAEFSPAERRVARLFLTGPPTLGLETVAQLAARAGVSAPTVIRFATRLGYQSFVEFQHAVRFELEARMASPIRQYDQHPPVGAETGLIHHAEKVFGNALEQTLRALAPHELETAIRLLCDPARRVFALGGRFSHVLARYLIAHLQELRPGAQLLSEAPSRRVAAMLDVGRRDVVAVFDYRRYQRDVVESGRSMHQNGAKLVLFTDPWLSPLAGVADAVLPASVAAPSPFDSLVAPMALVETVVAGMVSAAGEPGRKRVARYGALADTVVMNWDGDQAL
jgi:DNA-binding MurR/RpiR family transcriptional regulator